VQPNTQPQEPFRIEAHAHPLFPLKPEQQRLAWQKAVETAPNGVVTAAHVREQALQFTAKVPEKKLPRVTPLPPPVIFDSDSSPDGEELDELSAVRALLADVSKFLHHWLPCFLGSDRGELELRALLDRIGRWR
jgi:hypothetical protein